MQTKQLPRINHTTYADLESREEEMVVLEGYQAVNKYSSDKPWSAYSPECNPTKFYIPKATLLDVLKELIKEVK